MLGVYFDIVHDMTRVSMIRLLGSCYLQVVVRGHMWSGWHQDVVLEAQVAVLLTVLCCVVPGALCCALVCQAGCAVRCGGCQAHCSVLCGARRSVLEHQPKIVFLTSPNNPDGSILSDEDLLVGYPRHLKGGACMQLI
jgi:hypothetical protein